MIKLEEWEKRGGDHEIRFAEKLKSRTCLKIEKIRGSKACIETNESKRTHTHTRLQQKIQDDIDETFKLGSELKRSEIKIG